VKIDVTDEPRARIVVTGGPGGGKTTALDLFRREIGDRIIVVPEAATVLYAGGFPRTREAEARRRAQAAIFAVQRNLEEAQAATYPRRLLLCDRGTVDGAAYWPDDPAGFFAAVGTTYERELARYDAVIFFESAAVGGIGIEGGNPVRIEPTAEAARLDGVLFDLWSAHPRLVRVRHQGSFVRKILDGLEALDAIVRDLG
jgi:predicted ATPase